MARIRKSRAATHEHWDGKHKYEHWCRDNSVYFITARVRGGLHAFASPAAQAVFWNRLAFYTEQAGFEMWIVTLMINHYHFIGYMADASKLGEMMRKAHGSIAKLVNDTLPQRHLPFWREGSHHDYFDGCLRDEKQLRLTYRYVLTQGQRAGLVGPGELYRGTDPVMELDFVVSRAHQKNAFLSSVPYARYDRRKR